jgi:peptidoglycan/LPS O-acetylase OafA/YrhL
VLEYAGNFLRANDVGHLWFLPALFIVFLLSELILTLAERIPGIRKYPEIFLCAVAFGLYLEGYRIGFGYPPLLSAYSYLIWFSLGYLLNVHGELVRKIYRFSLLKWGMLAVNLAGLAYCVQAESVRVLLSLAVKALCVVNAYGAMPEKTCDIVEKVDRNSFGVYLFHSPLIYITFANIPNANPVIVVFINLVAFGAVAYGLTELIRRTKLKVLIGE